MYTLNTMSLCHYNVEIPKSKESSFDPSLNRRDNDQANTLKARSSGPLTGHGPNMKRTWLVEGRKF